MDINKTIEALAADFINYDVEMEILIGQAKGELDISTEAGVIALGKAIEPQNAWEFLQFLRGYVTPEGEQPAKLKGIPEDDSKYAHLNINPDPSAFMAGITAEMVGVQSELTDLMQEAGVSKEDAELVINDLKSDDIADGPAPTAAAPEPEMDELVKAHEDLKIQLESELKSAGVEDADVKSILDSMSPDKTSTPTAETGEIPDIKEVQNIFDELMNTLKNSPGFSEGSAAMGGI